jgi:hypothetical protein
MLRPHHALSYWTSSRSALTRAAWRLDSLVRAVLCCAVLSIRSYLDGSFRYSSGSILDEANEDASGIYNQDHLVPTGPRADPLRYGHVPVPTR